MQASAAVSMAAAGCMIAEHSIEAPGAVSVLNNGRCVTVKWLGEGYYSTAYVAEYTPATSSDKQCSDREKVALKKTRKDLAEIEVRALEALNPHKNIVNLIDYSVPDLDGKMLLAVELGDCSMDRLVGLWGGENTKLSTRHINFILAELLNAYTHIVQKGKIDAADISQGNVIYFRETGGLKLCDFGYRRGARNALSRIGGLAHCVLYRLSHNCTAMSGADRIGGFCSGKCEFEARSEPLITVMDWQSGISEACAKTIIRLSKAEYSSDELTTLMGDLYRNTDSLPVPKALQQN